jgi:methylenetetrahydrofolate dehydrogenase (NADP+) / methenyltetrahydrofolate cyclohydrolase
MVLELLWTPIADRMKSELAQRVKKNDLANKYIAIIYTGDNQASATYVRMKTKFANEIGLQLKVFGQDPKIETYEQLMDTIVELSYDDDCLGVMPQLPLAPELRQYQMELFDALPPYKDIDGLSSGFMGAYITEQLDFLGATPQAVMTLLDHYNLWNLEWKVVSIIWQSNLLWKPLTLACMRRRATVMTFNSHSNQNWMKNCCLNSDIIISCTGVVHLIDETFVRNDQSQVIIDVGRWIKDGKAVWDMTLDTMIDKVGAYTPIPWWVWPLTIANLMMNIKRLYDKYQ